MENKKIQGIIVGPTNIGKTTVLNELERVNNIKQIPLGKLTREGGIDPEIQRQLQECVKNKLPVPPELAVSAVLPFVNYFSSINENYFLDGVPRTKEEAEVFVRETAKSQALPNVLVSLIAEAETIFQRILKRVEHSVREEDFENYKIRFEQYLEQKEKVLSFLKNYMDILELDTTDKNETEVHQELVKLLGIK